MNSEQCQEKDKNNEASQPFIDKTEQDRIIRIVDAMGDDKVEAYVLIAAKYDKANNMHEFIVEYSSLFAIRELLSIGESFVDDATFIDWSGRCREDDGE